MIIIKTSKGDVLINEKDYVKVRHDREKHVVTLVPRNRQTSLKEMLLEVETVTYTNDAHPTEWTTEGSLVEHLKERQKSLSIELKCEWELNEKLKDRLRQLGHDCTQWVEYYGKDMSDDLCKRIRNRGEEEKSYVNNCEDWPEQIEIMERLRNENADEDDEVMRLHCIIDNLVAEVEREKKLIKDYNSVFDRLMGRNFWQRIINKEI